MLSKNLLGTGFIICFAIKGMLSSYYEYLPPPPPGPANNNKLQNDDRTKGTTRSTSSQSSWSSDQTTTTTTTRLSLDLNNLNDGFSVTITDPPRPPMNPGNLSQVVLSNKLKKAMYENTHMRDILLIHVGQAVGSSLFYSDNLAATAATPTSSKFGLEENRLANQTRLIINHDNLSKYHLRMKRATSFLFPLRSPPDRIHDVYRYTHPANCRQTSTEKEEEDGYNYGCWAMDPTKGNLMADDKSYYSKLWKDCFPSPNMELFAQELLPPYPTNNPRFIAKGFSQEQQQECRKLARTIVLGYVPPPTTTTDKNKKPSTSKMNEGLVAASPQMYYNYQFYQKQTFKKYANPNLKEIFAVRYETQYEYNDMVVLDAAMGGYGKFHNPPPPPSADNNNNNNNTALSPEATAKLCCVLAEEIATYWSIWDLSLNHNAQQRSTMSDQMRQQCSVTTGSSWSTWMRSCREQVEKLQSQ